eukprot:4294674-Amphidinium_carterae.1
MGNTYRHRCNYKCSITRSLQPHTDQTITTSRSTSSYGSDWREHCHLDYGIKEVTLVHDNMAIPA